MANYFIKLASRVLLIIHDKYKDHSDEELLNTFQQSNDKAIIGTLYQRYGHLVLGLCIKYLKNKHEAEDAALQIFAQLIDDLKTHQVKHFKSWLYVYSKNHCLMLLRKRQLTLRREIELKENLPLFMDFESDGHLNDKEALIMSLETAIDELKEEHKLCIRLFYLEGHSYQQVCDRTGYTANEVKSHIQNGKRQLKMKIEALNEARGK